MMVEPRSVFPGFAELDGLRIEIGEALAGRRRALGLSQSEIATRVGAPLGTVKSRVRGGMIQLRRSLRSLYGDGES